MRFRNWYDNIEPRIRKLVRFLRNRGWNTVSSCHHEMWVELDLNGTDEAERLATDLCVFGIKEFTVSVRIEKHGRLCWTRHATVELKKLPWKSAGQTQ